jgi:crotonobetainyl-CoA:carnitine CoA-transferase CaiB-like acyl-CoA transferase
MIDPDTTAGALAGIRVIDCASYIAAPAAATLLSDFGAEVIKIEPPEGDPYRRLVPGLSYPWDLDARNKRSLALDLKHPNAASILSRLVKGSDVFITNLPAAVRERLRIDAGSLRALNPRLIYASMSAHGERGPEAHAPGFDTTAYWARSGLSDLVKEDEDSAPSRSVTGMGDHPSAMSLYAAIMTALYLRERTGEGTVVRSSLLANGLWANAALVQASLNGTPPAPRPARAAASGEFSPGGGASPRCIRPAHRRRHGGCGTGQPASRHPPGAGERADPLRSVECHHAPHHRRSDRRISGG